MAGVIALAVLVVVPVAGLVGWAARGLWIGLDAATAAEEPLPPEWVNGGRP